MKKFKSGFISIIGRTNVGKSTLINSLVGEKVAITVNKNQTTRTAIKAIVNRERSQIVFIDTPGIHKPKNKLGETMNQTAWNMVTNVDLILFLIDATSSNIGKGDRMIIEKLKENKTKAFLIINKTDLVKKESLLQIIEKYSKEYDFKEIILISARDHDNIELLLNKIEEYLPEGPKYYEEDEYTDQTLRQLVEEIIREKALKLLDEEVPHGIYIEVEKMNMRKTLKKEDIYDIEAVIYCIRNSHKGIIIGKNGAMLKKIATYSRHDIEKMLNMKANLKVWVKVKEGWQDKDSIVKKFEM